MKLASLCALLALCTPAEAAHHHHHKHHRHVYAMAVKSVGTAAPHGVTVIPSRGKTPSAVPAAWDLDERWSAWRFMERDLRDDLSADRALKIVKAPPWVMAERWNVAP